jgi:opacity protein-like surface antigen
MERAERSLFAAAMLVVTILTPASAAAKTTTKTISVTATLTNGSSSSINVYVVGGTAQSNVSNDLSGTPPVPHTIVPIVRIGFDTDRSFQFVKRVHWDKTHHQLTIDF